jgi:hypothetical protein
MSKRFLVAFLSAFSICVVSAAYLVRRHSGPHVAPGIPRRTIPASAQTARLASRSPG